MSDTRHHLNYGPLIGLALYLIALGLAALAIREICRVVAHILGGAA